MGLSLDQAEGKADLAANASDPPADAEARDRTPADLRPRHLFPLIRHASCRISPWLARTPVTANQVTVAGTILGLLGVGLLIQDSLALRLAGAAAIAGTYLCDHCDGEVARLKRIESQLGDILSEIGGALVNASLFLAVGWKAAATSGESIWLWCGVATALGAFLNLIVALTTKEQPSEQELDDPDLSLSIRPGDLGGGWRDKALYAFRELLRADLWVLLVALGVFELLWILLPATAIGAQVYWVLGLTRSARRFHA